jgi:hypothetical protein
MARKKPPIKPMSTLRFDFVDSLENLCQQALMLMTAVDTVLARVPSLPGHDILAERSAALRAALISED